MHSLLSCSLLLLLLQNISATPVSKKVSNMNGLYTISNPNTAATNEFNSDYNSFSDVEYFEVYSPPISTKYSEVYWTMMDPVPMDKDLVARFQGKTMAIVGYETDQVIVTEGQHDVSVPITHAYNHHFEAYLSGSLSEMRKVEGEEAVAAMDRGMNNHGAPAFFHTFRREDIGDPNADSDVPTSQFFSEGNGGEFRKSFHGYPKGFAQFIESPTTFHIQPMQIDTKNRHYNGSDFRADLLPKASAAPADAAYSGLLECPCTDRIEKTIEVEYTTQSQGSCATTVGNATECFVAASKVQNGKVDANSTVTSTDLPSDCSLVKYENGTTIAFFNEASSKAACGGGQMFTGSYEATTALTKTQVRLNAKVTGGEASITISGPATKWFAVAFGTPNFAMADKPWTVVVDGKGNVEERKLGDHDPGQVLSSSVRVTSNTVVDGERTVVMSREFKGKTPDHFTFDASNSEISVITASGTGPSYAYHGPKQRTGGKIQLSGVDVPTCVCNAGVKGAINGIPFHKNCLPEPRGDLVQQKNPTCWIETYQGGLSCCHHQNILLDRDQTPPEELLTYHMKFRFYFQPYTAASADAPASHQNLLRMYYQTEANAGEYDVPKCEEGTPSSMCTHEITAHFTVADMAQKCDIRKNPGCWGEDYDKNHQGINLIYAGGHCHAPSCISMELFHADTGKLLCAHYPTYGQTHQVFDELGYLAIPPCIWGTEEEGLIAPVFLPFNANLTSIKRNNNTYAHYGEMASWQMRGILADLPIDV